MNVVVTGGYGQLGSCLRSLTENTTDKNSLYRYVGHDEMDITNYFSIESALDGTNVGVIINCAAYTNVDKAEDEIASCEKINGVGVYNLANYCKKNNIFFIHISTDFVFDGGQDTPYMEDDMTMPINRYGLTKLFGERMVTSTMNGNYIIIRTSWLYSEYGKNFAKTMLGRVKNETPTRVVTDQIGTPTYAMDLASFIFELVEGGYFIGKSDTYHFSNEGSATWYEFAKKIEVLEKGRNEYIIEPCLTRAYPTKASRPQYSVMDKSKLKKDFPWASIPQWEESVEKWYTKC